MKHTPARKRRRRKPPSLSDIKGFNEILVESIIEGLDFGEVVLRFIELNSSVRREEITQNPQLFAQELENLYGTRMGDIFEERILRILCKKIGIEYSKIENYTFQKSVNKAFQEYLNLKHAARK